MGSAKAYPTPQADRLRSDALLRLERVADLQSMGVAQLIALQSALGFGDEWGTLRVPPDWMPPGPRRRPSACTLALHRALPTEWDPKAPDSRSAIAALMKFAFVRYLTPSSRRAFYPTITTWQAAVADTIRVARSALLRQHADPNVIWARLTESDVLAALPGKSGPLWIRTMHWLHGRSAITDCVQPGPSLHGAIEERSRKGEAKPKTVLTKANPWQPLPDAFVAEAGWRVAWIVKQLAPTLLDLAEALFTARAHDPRFTAKTNGNLTTEARREILARWQWNAPDGRPLDCLPFQLHMKSKTGQAKARASRPPLAWPIQSPGDVETLLHVLQACHVFILFLSSGPRSGEQLSLRTNCLEETTDYARFTGRTYKLVFRNEGRARDWPCPDIGRQAIQQQVRLAAIYKTLGSEGFEASGDHLWVVTGNRSGRKRGEELLDFNNPLRRLSNVLGLNELLGKAPLHTHRFRKTIARLIALALIGAPKILMDLFGHSDIEMTINYILSDPDLRAEVEMVAKAQLLILAKDAASSADRNGGPAAKGVHDVVNQTKARLGKTELDSDDLEEVAVALTLGGTIWQLVRPGVICTKTAFESGPCTRRIGRPEPSRCQASCLNRLELESERENVDGILMQAVTLLEQAQRDDDPIRMELWRGQVLTHLNRFDDLHQKWGQHPAVANFVLNETLSETIK